MRFANIYRHHLLCIKRCFNLSGGTSVTHTLLMNQTHIALCLGKIVYKNAKYSHHNLIFWASSLSKGLWAF